MRIRKRVVQRGGMAAKSGTKAPVTRTAPHKPKAPVKGCRKC